MLHVMLDNGHGADTPGKCSPDKKLLEYRWAREVVSLIAAGLKGVAGIETHIITPEEMDIPLRTRTRRINDLCARYGKSNCLSISVHVNAAGADGKWHTARGWCVMVSQNASAASKRFAQIIYAEADKRGLRGNRAVPKEHYWVQSLAMCRDTTCPAVLTENMFMDNKEDCALLLTDAGKAMMVQVHIDAVKKYAAQQP